MSGNGTKFEPASLFGASVGPALVAVQGSKATLSKSQREFNRLSAQIARERERIAQWEGYVERYAQRTHAELLPAIASLRAAQRKLIARFDALLAVRTTGERLSGNHRKKLCSLIVGLIRDVLADQPDPELEALHDKHSDVSGEEARRMDLDHARDMMAALLGDDLVEGHQASSVEELMAHVHERMGAQNEATERERETRAAARAAKRGRPTAAELAAERRAQAAKEASASVREIYRRLASTLHPDRETDAAERERKTQLMQRANQAYERGDVLDLLRAASLSRSTPRMMPPRLGTETSSARCSWSVVRFG